MKKPAELSLQPADILRLFQWAQQDSNLRLPPCECLFDPYWHM
jgi:hypothetical protein